MRQHRDLSLPSRTEGPTGIHLVRPALPPADTRRWVSRRKAQVVASVRAGLITIEDALRRYALSIEEFLAWERLLDRHGTAGPRVTRTKAYRMKPHPAHGTDAAIR